MIHPHLKSNEELLSIWNGDFHDIDQMQALEQLARRRVDDFSEQLKLALASGDLDYDDIKWTYFEYIYDNSFVIDYVNNPKNCYNKEKAISYIEWAIITNDFCLSDYLKLNNKVKDELQHLFINKLKDETTYICDFESYIMRYGSHDHLQIFEEAIEHIINKDYIEFLKQNKETSRLMAIDSQIAKMKNMFHQSFVNWLYGISHPSANPSTHCHRGYERTVGHFKHSYDYSDSVLLNKLQEILSGANLTLGEMPDVYITYELPRSFKLVDNHDEEEVNLFDTESLLGYYIPEKQEINLMELGIQWCAKELNIDVDLLREIVFIHELGHYMQHKMPCYQTQEWKYDLYIRSYTPIDLQEGWAQLMAAWVVKDKKDYSHVFQSLIAVQSAPYHVFKDYERDPYRRILNSLDGLRQLGRPAKITDWETFL